MRGIRVERVGARSGGNRRTVTDPRIAQSPEIGDEAIASTHKAGGVYEVGVGVANGDAKEKELSR